MWTAWLRGLGELVELADPADERELLRAESEVGLALPRDLRSLLAETDGLADAQGRELVWPVERIAEENAPLRAGLLVFGDTGGEDLLAYGVGRADGPGARPGPGPDILLWEHARDGARWIAPDLQSLLDDWFAGGGRP